MKILKWSYPCSSWYMLWGLSQIFCFFLKYIQSEGAPRLPLGLTNIFLSLFNEPLVQMVPGKILLSLLVLRPLFFISLSCHYWIAVMSSAYKVRNFSVLTQSTHDCCLMYLKVLILISWRLLDLVVPYPVLRYCSPDIPRLVCEWCGESPAAEEFAFLFGHPWWLSQHSCHTCKCLFRSVSNRLSVEVTEE